MRQEIMEFWDAVASATNYMLLASDRYRDTLSLNFYRPAALPGAQPTVSKDGRHQQRRFSERLTFEML